MTNTFKISDKHIKSLDFEPNNDQLHALEMLIEFIEQGRNKDFFILTGPAGCGKTSLVKSLTEHFLDSDIKFYLSAPTGRSAQIISSKTNCTATTLHSLLYTPNLDEQSMKIILKPKSNHKHEDQRFFIVDEASMINDTTSDSGMFFQYNSLLKQLFHFAKQGNTSNKVIFIGDQHQLPPVHSSFSPALSSNYIMEKFNLNGMSYDLKTVERQCDGSYILHVANEILSAINSESTIGAFQCQQTSSFSASINHYLSNYSDESPDSAIMIAFANGQVNALNTWTRNFRYNYKNRHIIMPNEFLLCNHSTIAANQALTKGTHFYVRKTWKPEEFAGLHFINAEIEFINAAAETVNAQSKIMLESVSSQDGSITIDAEKKLLHEAFRRNKQFRETKNPQDDAFVSAIRARYGYALTGHKAQGGEWNNVYIHPGYRKDHLRWLYTAVTRASEDLYSWKS